MISRRFPALVALLALSHSAGAGGDERARRQAAGQDARGGLPSAVLSAQDQDGFEVPSLEDAIRRAREAAREAAEPVTTGARQGRVLRVPGDHATIQAAIDAARPGDTVEVGAGTWREQILLRAGVRLASDPANGGDEPVAVEGAALPVPRRALRTILDGTGFDPSSRGVVDVEPGAGRDTVLDGFTIQNLAKQDHHRPDHAHAINIRGASPIVVHNLVRDNGSTGIGCHAVFDDPAAAPEARDLREARVHHKAEPVIYGNVVRGNFGLGIGSNFYCRALIAGNEVFANDDSALGQQVTPGIGAKHGAAPRVVGNVVHDNPGGGVLVQVGEPIGAHSPDRATALEAVGNVVYRNGPGRPAIAARGAGTAERPVLVRDNVVLESGGVGIALVEGAVGSVVGNTVAGAASAGIAIVASTSLALDGNRVSGAGGPGYVMKDGAEVRHMAGNAAMENAGPRFMVMNALVSGTEP